MTDYEELKTEMVEIAAIVKSFPDALQERVYDLLASSYTGVPRFDGDGSTNRNGSSLPGLPPRDVAKESGGASAPASKRRATPSRESFTIDKDLNLRGNGSISFREFCELKNPKSNIDFNVVAVYYLSHQAGIAAVTLNHLFTCYKEMNRPVPERLRQSVHDTSGSRYGYLDAGDMANIRIPTRGQNRVEHELPSKPKK